jgi:glycosyltransferase involved in cell wall biosynthesis
MTIVLAVTYGGLFLILCSNLIYLRWHRTAPDDGSDATELPFASILIPARNEADNLRRLLPSIRQQRGINCEIIVVDDESDDGTAAVVEEAVEDAGDGSIRLLRGTDLPGGWTGKSYALDRAAREAAGELLVCLDADTEFTGTDGLGKLVQTYVSYTGPTVLTAFPRMRGGGQLLVSLVPFTIFTFLPWPLVQGTRSPSLSALNGQCWMITAELYDRYRPHEEVRDEVLEDVEIGRYLKSQGVTPVMVDLRDELSVYMYESFVEAWQGFRKNAYPLAGGTPIRAAASLGFFTVLFIIAPVIWPWSLAAAWSLKLITDRYSGFSPWVSLGSPVSFVLGLLLQADSMLTHLRGRVKWKGRRVSSNSPSDYSSSV